MVSDVLKVNLNRLEMDAAFLVLGSDDVVRYLNNHMNFSVKAFSVDVKDLFYFLPRNGFFLGRRRGN